MRDFRVEVGGRRQEGFRKTRSDKRICVKANLNQESHLLLHRLSMTLGKSKTSLATEIMEIILRNPSFVNWIQDYYQVPEEHRLIPLSNNGEVTY